MMMMMMMMMDDDDDDDDDDNGDGDDTTNSTSNNLNLLLLSGMVAAIAHIAFFQTRVILKGWLSNSSARNVIDIVQTIKLIRITQVLFLFPTGDLISHPYEINKVDISDDLRRLTNRRIVSISVGWLTNASWWDNSIPMSKGWVGKLFVCHSNRADGKPMR